MSVRFLDLAEQNAQLADELREAFERVTARSSYILGEELVAFEEEFAAYCGAAHCIGVGNGCDALELSLRAMGIGSGDEVLVPAFTFAATWFSVSRIGARPVPVEVRSDTALMDPSRIEAAITPRTRAILPVHLFGQPADMAEIETLAREYHLDVLEDAAQAQGSTYRGRAAGSLARAAAFSFYPGKNLGALGDGGAVVTNDADLAARVRSFRNYGSQKKYFHTAVAGNSRLDELQAAFLRAKLRHLDRWNAARRMIAGRYRANLERFESPAFVLPVIAPERETNWHLYVVQVQNRSTIQGRLRSHDVETLVHYPIPVHRQQAYAGQYDDADLTLTEQLSDSVLSLPMGPTMTRQQVDEVCRGIEDALEHTSAAQPLG